MDYIPINSPDSLKKAREFEQRLLSAAPESGILFAGAEVVSRGPDQEPLYIIFVGVSRDQKLETATSLVRMILADELEDGRKIRLEVSRGQIRS